MKMESPAALVAIYWKFAIAADQVITAVNVNETDPDATRRWS